MAHALTRLCSNFILPFQKSVLNHSGPPARLLWTKQNCETHQHFPHASPGGNLVLIPWPPICIPIPAVALAVGREWVADGVSPGSARKEARLHSRLGCLQQHTGRWEAPQGQAPSQR